MASPPSRSSSRKRCGSRSSARRPLSPGVTFGPGTRAGL
jgi:hypothetical protein